MTHSPLTKLVGFAICFSATSWLLDSWVLALGILAGAWVAVGLWGWWQARRAA